MTFEVRHVNSHHPDFKCLIDSKRIDSKSYSAMGKLYYGQYLENVVVGYVFNVPISFGALIPVDDSTVRVIFITTAVTLFDQDLFNATLQILEDNARSLDYSIIIAEYKSEGSECFKMHTSLGFSKMPFQKNCNDNISEKRLFKLLID